MSLIIHNSKDLINSKNLRLKILAIGMAGTGKTTFMSTFPNLGVGVCETGHGKGLMSIASLGLEYVDLTSYNDFESFCSGTVFKEKESLGLDSLSEMVKTFIKDKALSLPRAKGESQKRTLGVPELDDYGVMGELTRKLVRKLLDHDKHIIATTGLRIDKPDAESGQGEMLVGPDLAGQMFLGSTAMFDLVLQLRTRSVLRDPKDAKSRYTQRYWITESPGNGIIAKNRLSVIGGKSFLPAEMIFDPETNQGTFQDFYNRATKAYSEFLAKSVVMAQAK